MSNPMNLQTIGCGILSGFSVTAPSGVVVSSGSAIDVTGDYITAGSAELTPELPTVFPAKQTGLLVSTAGRIQLSRIPYAPDKLSIAAYAAGEGRGHGITVVREDSGIAVPVVAVGTDYVDVDPGLKQVSVYVEYSYTTARYDRVYVTTENGVKISKLVKGAHSAMPVKPVPNNYQLLLNSVLINPYSLTGPNNTYVTAKTVMDDARKANIYTSAEQEMFINGISVKDACTFYSDPPAEPKENDLWFDAAKESVKVYKKYDGMSYWLPLNNNSAKATEMKIWTEATCPVDLQSFLFSLPEEMNMCFTPGTNALTIVINNKVLMGDQFEELIDETKVPAMQGVGFRIHSPLDESSYVQAMVNHSAAQPNLAKVYQRSSIIRDTNDFTIIGSSTQIFNTGTNYSVGDHQLTVYVNGIRMTQAAFEEGTDLTAPVSGELSKQFKVLTPLSSGSTVSYVIDKNVFSYSSFDGTVKQQITDLEANMDAVLQALNLNMN
jgi:hypothetical protein